MRNVIIVIFAVMLVGLHPALAEEARGLTTVVRQVAGDEAAVGTQYAVLIAVNRYRDWNALRHPVEDAREIREILSRRYFVDRFIELYDEAATKAGIIRLFNQLISTTKPEDGVFIFFAGHGHLDPMSDTGFWIPADGGMDRFAQDNWLPNSQIRGFISKMKARHVVLMSDSCFSGDILNPTRAITPEITSEYFRKAYSRVSRQVITSGASEAVPDSSEFARGLKLALEGNTAPQLDPLMLYQQVRLGMRATTPLFGDLKDSGHQDGASFLFFLREGAARARAGDDVPTPSDTGPALTIEKPSGTLVVRVGSAGALFVDSKDLGMIPEGGTARLERLEAGSHTVSMRFADNRVEGRTVILKADETMTLEFGGTLAASAPVPTASIRIDGVFDDWKDVRPLFIREPPGKAGEELNLKMARVSLAKDSQYLYVRYDIADQAKPTLLRPYNFSDVSNSEYQLVIHLASSTWVSLIVGYDTRKRAWSAYAVRGAEPHQRLGLGSHQKKGSTLEARFPLSAFKGVIAEGTTYGVMAQVGYNTGEPDWRWHRTDVTEMKQVTF